MTDGDDDVCAKRESDDDDDDDGRMMTAGEREIRHGRDTAETCACNSLGVVACGRAITLS